MNAVDRTGESTGASSYFTGCLAEVEGKYEVGAEVETQGLLCNEPLDGNWSFLSSVRLLL
jgi:hypothetical protein